MPITFGSALVRRIRDREKDVCNQRQRYKVSCFLLELIALTISIIGRLYNYFKSVTWFENNELKISILATPSRFSFLKTAHLPVFRNSNYKVMYSRRYKMTANLMEGCDCWLQTIVFVTVYLQEGDSVKCATVSCFLIPAVAFIYLFLSFLYFYFYIFYKAI